MELIVTTLELEPGEWGEKYFSATWDEQRIKEFLHNDRFIEFSMDKELPSVDETISLLMEFDDIVCVETVEDHQKRTQEDQRKKLELTAATLARRHGVEVNSVEFLELLDREVERTQSYREGMREDGLCIGYGVDADQWQDEFNASQSDTSKLYDLQDWMRENLPLLCAKHDQDKELVHG